MSTPNTYSATLFVAAGGVVVTHSPVEQVTLHCVAELPAVPFGPPHPRAAHLLVLTGPSARVVMQHMPIAKGQPLRATWQHQQAMLDAGKPTIYCKSVTHIELLPTAQQCQNKLAAQAA